MPYPPGAYCGNSYATAPTGAGIIIGPGVTSISGFPPCFIFPGIYGPDYVSGTASGTPGIYECTINGLPTTIILAGDFENYTTIPDTTWDPVRFTVGVASTFAFTATGTHGPFTFRLYSDVYPHCPPLGGPMPPGLTFNADGSITGTPTTAGDYVVQFVILDSLFAGPLSGVVFEIRNAPPAPNPLTMTCGGPPAGTVGTAYSHSFPVSGGFPPYAWELWIGALPDGLTLNGSTGAVTGTPTTAGVFDFDIRVSDSTGDASVIECSITIGAAPAPGAPLALTCGGPPAGVVGTAYSHTFAASGGAAPYLYTLAGGLLPAGLTVDVTGAVSGIPAAAGTFAFSISVLDSVLAGAAVNCSITITAAAAAAGASVPIPLGRTAFPVALPDPTKECK